MFFDRALAAYKRALEYTSEKLDPHLWAAIITQIGKAYYELGIRSEEPELSYYLSAAVDSYQQALKIQEREELLQDWARTWSQLGGILREQGIRLGGEEGRQLLTKAVAACQQVLEVQTLKAFPWIWTQAQQNLAYAYLALGEWLKAATYLSQLLQIYPDNEEAYYTAILLYHERLFAFEEAFLLSQKWLDLHPDDLESQSQFVEQNFTTSRFAESIEYLTVLLMNPVLEIQVRVPLQAFEVAALLILDLNKSATEKFRSLYRTIASQSENFSLEWTFIGTKHFIAQSKQLLSYRSWLLNLFTALEEKNREAILIHLKEDIPAHF